MENSWSRQLEFWACPTFLGPLDYRLFPKAHMVWTVNNFCLRKLEVWVCPHFFYQLNCFVRHALLGLSVFLAMENPCLRQIFEVIQLFLDNWIVDCFIRCVWYALWKFCLRQLEFWACPHVFNQLRCFVRHAWLALSVFSHDENSRSRKFFEVIQLFLDNLIADCWVWWWKILAWGSWSF